MTDLIQCEIVHEGIARVMLNRPSAHNALNWAMATQLRAVLTQLSEDPTCRVIVLAAAGPSFCAGLDLKSCVFGADAADGAIEAMRLQEHFAGVMPLIRRLPQPVVAAIQGAAVGAGLGLALAADVRLIGQSARLAVGAVKIGLSAGECGISYHLPRMIGASRAFEIMLTGRTVLAEEADRIGLASRLVADADLGSDALDLARAIASNSPYASKHTKQVMWSNLDAPSFDAAIELENHVQTVAMLTVDFREGAQAFAEKRPPNFSGR